MCPPLYTRSDAEPPNIAKAKTCSSRLSTVTNPLKKYLMVSRDDTERLREIMGSSSTTATLRRRSRPSSTSLFEIVTHSSFYRIPPSIFRIVVLLSILSLAVFFLNKVDNYASRLASETKTVAGHNLDQTPWHHFTPKQFNENTKYSKASKFFKCSSALKCTSVAAVVGGGSAHTGNHQNTNNKSSTTTDSTCPSYFRWIHHDLEPWARSRISRSKLMEAQKSAAFRVVIVGGRLYVDFYYSCFQTRAMFTIWGLVQLLRRYPGLIPDVDLMFDCMDRPVVSRGEFKPPGSGSKSKRWPPPPLFRYCTTNDHFDVPFPDWSFWGWVETNIQPWDEEFRSIKEGSQALNWNEKWAHAYWKGNPDVGSAIRKDLLHCNDKKKWGAEILRQNWFEEAKNGFEQSKLSNQCKHRYKIYAEGFAWSVSLKYIIACGSPTLIISPRFEDFFSRGLLPKENYWPVTPSRNLCPSIKFAVDWGNSNPSQAEAIGKGGQNLMENLSMEKVYDYMYHLISEYSKLQDFKPVPPSTAQEICAESILCYADPREREFLKKSTVTVSSSPPCNLPPADHDLIETLRQKKNKIINQIQRMEKKRISM